MRFYFSILYCGASVESEQKADEHRQLSLCIGKLQAADSHSSIFIHLERTMRTNYPYTRLHVLSEHPSEELVGKMIVAERPGAHGRMSTLALYSLRHSKATQALAVCLTWLLRNNHAHHSVALFSGASLETNF